MRENLLGFNGRYTLLSLKRVYNEGRAEVNKLNTTYGIARTRFSRYTTVQIKIIFQRLRTPQKVSTAKRPHCSSFRAKMAPPTTISCVEHHAYKVMNEPQVVRMALPTS